MNKYAKLVQQVSIEINSLQGAYCGVDLLASKDDNDTLEKKYKAWKAYIFEHKMGLGTDKEERNNIWVPSIF